MLLRSRMGLSELSENFIQCQDEKLERVKNLIIKKNLKVVLDPDNFYLDDTTHLKFHCLICDKDFYLNHGMLKYSRTTDCSRHELNVYIEPEETTEERAERKERIRKNMEEARKEEEEFPLRNEAPQTRKLKIYLSRKYSAKLEFRECINPKTGYFLPYDIYIPMYKTYIEVNGSQHYHLHDRYHKNKEDLEYQKYKDQVKKEHAERNGFFIVLKLQDFYGEPQLYYSEEEKPKDIIEEVEKMLSEIEERMRNANDFSI